MIRIRHIHMSRDRDWCRYKILPPSRIDCRLGMGFEHPYSAPLLCTWTPLLSLFTESLMNPTASYNDRDRGTEGV
jgi:hypothetical protein